ncbi:MAG: hypothetical protein IT461_03750 [Planctomycetes bacterium]|nr:hypothetical protein [Planctomycetota bacterium]
MQFDISAVPVGANVSNIEFNGYVYQTYYPFWSITPVTSNPLTAAAATLYADIEAEAITGYYLYQNENSSYAAGWKVHNLVGTAASDLGTARSSGTTFTLGIATRDTVTSYYNYFHGYADANKPYIRVTYTGGGPTPTINVTSAANPLNLGTTPQGTAGTPASYTVSGANLGTNNIVITAPSTSVQLSLTSGGTYTASLNLTPSGGTVPSTTIYARISAAAPVGAVSGNISHTSTGATTQNLPVTGTVTTPVPTILITSATNPLNLGTTITGTAGTPASYTVTGANLTADIVVTAPANVELSQTGAAGAYANAQTLAQTGGSVNATIHARITAAAPVGAISGNITHTSTGATTQNLAVTGNVTVPPPTINITGVTPPLALGTVFQGTAGTPVSYGVSGSNLIADIVVTAPANVEISQTGATGPYATLQTLAQAGGTVTATIFARIAASASVGAVTGNITHTSTGATTQNVAVSGTVNPTAPDMTAARGATNVADGSTDSLGNRPFGVATSLTYTIGNAGTAALSLSGTPPVVATAGTNCTVNVTTQPTPTSVAVAATVTFVVAVTPTAAGAFNCTISIANNDPGAGKNPYNWTIDGTGVTAPAMTLSRTAAIADGGTDAIGTVSTTIPLTLTYTVGNTGTATLNLNGTPRVAVSGLTNCVVSVTTQPAATVAVAGSTTFAISVRATNSGAMSFTISIANDDPVANPYNITVNGTGAGGVGGGGVGGGGGGGGGGCQAGDASAVPAFLALLAVMAALMLGARRVRV